jgi:hypothetical protein
MAGTPLVAVVACFACYRVLEAEAARLVAKFGSETIRLIAWGQLVSVNLDFESDSDDEDSLY